nr:hypothetical protein [Tanacetum cinerariifolium]
DYQPSACTQKTYYRRVSTHLEGRIYPFNPERTQWYISNIVVINPQAQTPTPVSATYTSCTGSGNVVVAINPSIGATSYNWWVPYAGWGVSTDGQNPYSTYNNQGSFITPSTRVYISIPANASPGTYNIAVSANGPCGPKTPDAIITIYIIAGSNPTAAPANAGLRRTGSGCNTLYDITMPAVANATTYYAVINGFGGAQGTLSNGNVLFNYGFPVYSYSYQVSGTITAYGSCNSLSTTFTFNVPSGGRTCSGGRSADPSTSLTTYPNPATEEVIMETDGSEGVASFYDAKGTLRKTVKIKSEAVRTNVNVRDLPAGIYHLRLVLGDERVLQKQVVIEK